MNILSIILLLTGWVIPQPQTVESSDKVFDKSHLENIVYREVQGMPEEAYELQIRNRRIVIRSSSPAGRFYAEKTLEQLSAADVMHCMTIRDEPRFEWRGFMLDEARHFFGKEKVKQLLDMMSRYKLNRFHWHLSDSQGWRIEIKTYPQLCETGAVGCYSDRNSPAQFYTQDDIREIVEYAAARHIEVIPEIDMPGHARAAVKSIPEIDGKRGTFNPGSEKTYEVLGTVIKELAELFPGRYIHIGGDEVENKDWPALPEVKELMTREKLQDIAEVQAYFGRRMADTVSFYGKQMVGWDDMLDSGTPSEGKVLHWWRTKHPEYFERGLANGFRMVVCPNLPFYLDYIQSEADKVGHGSKRKQINTLQDIYGFRIEDHPLVVGAQCNLWTEQVGDGKRIDYMVFPRLLALAELAWTRVENMDYKDFLERLYKEYDYMDSTGVYYYDMRNPSAHPEPAGPVKVKRQ